MAKETRGKVEHMRKAQVKAVKDREEGKKKRAEGQR